MSVVSAVISAAGAVIFVSAAIFVSVVVAVSAARDGWSYLC